MDFEQWWNQLPKSFAKQSECMEVAQHYAKLAFQAGDEYREKMIADDPDYIKWIGRKYDND